MAWQYVKLVFAESFSANRLNSGFSIETKYRMINDTPLGPSLDWIRLNTSLRWAIWYGPYHMICSMILKNKILTLKAVAKYFPKVEFQSPIQILKIIWYKSCFMLMKYSETLVYRLLMEKILPTVAWSSNSRKFVNCIVNVISSHFGIIPKRVSVKYLMLDFGNFS